MFKLCRSGAGDGDGGTESASSGSPDSTSLITGVIMALRGCTWEVEDPCTQEFAVNTSLPLELLNAPGKLWWCLLDLMFCAAPRRLFDSHLLQLRSTTDCNGRAAAHKLLLLFTLLAPPAAACKPPCRCRSLSPPPFITPNSAPPAPIPPAIPHSKVSIATSKCQAQAQEARSAPGPGHNVGFSCNL
jgi:hypothetical protein